MKEDLKNYRPQSMEKKIQYVDLNILWSRHLNVHIDKVCTN